MRVKVLRPGLGVLTLLLLSSPVVAATVNALSCSASDVQSAVNAARTADVVAVPTGTCTYTTGVVIDGKNITLQGAGIDVTTVNAGNTVVVIHLKNTATRITGFTFNGGRIDSGRTDVPGQLNNDWRIDRNRFINKPQGASILIQCSASSATPGQHCRGVVDHNRFENGAFVLAMGFTATPDLHRTWALPTNLGSQNAVFIEDNTFSVPTGLPHYVDTNYGGRFVFRFNAVANEGAEVHSLGAGARTSRAWEIYANVVTGPGWTAGLIRGGTGVAWGNQHDSDRSPWALDNERSYLTSPQAYGACDGTSTADGNTSGQNGWPCRDQIGRGQDACLSNPSDLTKSARGWCATTSEPAYFFLNRTGTTITDVDTRSGRYPAANPIQLNRDVFNEVRPFNGTSGVGTGPIANRPTTCTMGVAYWATDEGSWNTKLPANTSGRLYTCASTNTWMLYYTPYTYPHPLAQGTSPPSPPSN